MKWRLLCSSPEEGECGMFCHLRGHAKSRGGCCVSHPHIRLAILINSRAQAARGWRWRRSLLRADEGRGGARCKKGGGERARLQEQRLGAGDERAQCEKAAQ